MNLDYHYNRLSLIEVPVQFLCHHRFWKLQPETVQPEQVFLQEKGVFNSLEVNDLKRLSHFVHNTSESKHLTQNDIQNFMFQRLIKKTILEVSPQRSILRGRRMAKGKQGISLTKVFANLSTSFEYDYNIFPNFYTFMHGFSSDKYPIFDSVVAYHYKSRFFHHEIGVINNITLMDSDVLVRQALSKRPLSQVFTDSNNKKIGYEILKNKSAALFKHMEAQLGDDIFDGFLNEYIRNNRYKTSNALHFFKELKELSAIDFEPYIELWQNEMQLPKFEVYDVTEMKVTIDGKTAFQYYFTIYNSGAADGVIDASIFVRDDVQSHLIKTIHLKSRQAKKIGIIHVHPFSGRTLMLRTFNALNKEIITTPFNVTKYRYDSELFDGEYIVEPPPKDPGIIVDNSDPGFTVLTQPGKSFVMKLLHKSGDENNGLIRYDRRNTLPKRWREGIKSFFYGEIENTAHYIQSGNGNQKVQWSAIIPESNTYDMYYYTQDKSKFRIPSLTETNYTVDDFNFTVYHDDGIDDVTLDLNNAKQGWTYVGSYYLSKGRGIVELSDKSKGKLVYADAVKWVKK